MKIIILLGAIAAWLWGEVSYLLITKAQQQEKGKEVKPEEQRIAIAEACGWTEVKSGWSGQQIFGYQRKTDGYVTRVPDYLNDLNAMHEVEKILTPGPWHTYEYKLGMICKRDGMSFVHATASQRAEAFLRTLGLWKEEGKK